MGHISTYLDTVHTRFKAGISREHSYRGDLQNLLMTLLPDILVTNEPARIACGAPDYVLTRNNIAVGYIEAKDVGVDLGSKILKKQLDRYKAGLPNLIITDYLNFQFYKEQVLTATVQLAVKSDDSILPIPENFERFINLINDFASSITQTIKSPTKLAVMMAGKANLMADIIKQSLDADDESDTRSKLKGQMLSFKAMLIHDIDNSGFADIYAQTIAYGMFAARYHDPTLPTFSRHEAATLIPRSNPFLRQLFQDIAGYELDNRISWIVDDLVNIFLAADVAEIMSNFGKSTKQEDPVVHFYETFLAAYNPALRKKRGVWYTPQPVVNFIVRAVDDILKKEFNLSHGLADTSKIKIRTKHITKATSDRNSKLKEVEAEHQVHKVQILDPATGTGTFLAEVVRHIYQKFDGQQGIWSNYVNQHLIPRLNGFELLMASYAMAHLKMDMLLSETGYKATTDQRFRIFLTNSLEEAHPDTRTLFSTLLSVESEQANVVKRDTPVMVVMGNPPYNGESTNKGEWIMKLMDDYKKEPGGILKLKEKNSKWLNDDYVKFLRFGQFFIEKNGSGILAFINPHGFLDNPTFRGMRWRLLKTYDKIYTIDLHGNSNKKEKAADGSVDKNVFDIKQGVSINIFVKTGEKESDSLGTVFNFDLFGGRESKYDFLINNSLQTIPFKQSIIKGPNYFFTNKDYIGQGGYDEGISINEIFNVSNSGIVSKRDKLNIHHTKETAITMLHDVINLDESHCRAKYQIPNDVRDWNFSLARKDILDSKSNPSLIKPINYRPFDKRFIYYTGKSKGVVGWPVPVVSEHLLHSDNLGLMTNKKVEVGKFTHYVVYRGLVESHAVSMKEINYVFPLYLYPPQNGQQTIEVTARRKPNLNMAVVQEIARKLDFTFTDEKEITENTFSPIDILDYIYAVLHSQSYRDTYQEFLKINFPRVPYPTNPDEFWRLVRIGGELREVHLLESALVEKMITQYPVDGDNVVQDLRFKSSPGESAGKVWINETQYFDKVPLEAWEFFVGGYQPAQKWLKDRKGRELGFEDILHYQKIIVALNETSRLMKEVDEVTEVY